MIKMNRKGQISEGLPPETMKIILSLISIVILIAVGVSLYKMLTVQKEVDQASEILKQVYEKVNSAESSGTMLLTGPNNWYLLSTIPSQVCVEKCKGCTDSPKEDEFDANHPTQKCLPLTGKKVLINMSISIAITTINFSFQTENGEKIVEIKKYVEPST